MTITRTTRKTTAARPPWELRNSREFIVRGRSESAPSLEGERGRHRNSTRCGAGAVGADDRSATDPRRERLEHLAAARVLHEGGERHVPGHPVGARLELELEAARGPGERKARHVARHEIVREAFAAVLARGHAAREAVL